MHTRFRSPLLLLLAPLVALGVAPIHAQPAYMVADLQTEATPDGSFISFGPRIVESEDLGFFFHDDGIHGWELWRTDGSALGTFLMKDVCPGLCGARGLSGLNHLTVLGGSVFFTGNDGVHGTELWMSDGTALGTSIVRDIRPGASPSAPSQLVTAAGQIFFSADDGVHGRELWRSDGTLKGTYLVDDVTAGPDGDDIFAIFAGGDQLYLSVGGSNSQRGLWVSDGTPSGTLRIADLGVSIYAPFKGRAFQFLPSGLLLFAASGPTLQDYELWRSDGTALGTYRVKDLYLGIQGSDPSTFMSYGNEIVFLASSSLSTTERVLWRSDGSESGTTEIPAPAGYSPRPDLGLHATVGGHLFFAAYDPDAGLELWDFDGTDAHRVSDIRLGPASSIDQIGDLEFNRALFADAGGRLVFLADDGLNGLEFWTSDGSDAGTERISDLFPGFEVPRFDGYVQLNPAALFDDRLLIRAFDPLAGYRLVASDGTAAGTGFLDTIGLATSSFLPLRDAAFPYGQTGPPCAERASDRLVFKTTLDYFEGAEVWGTDGSAAGTQLLAPASIASAYPGGCTSLGGNVLFFSDHGGLPALWSTSGTTDSTILLADLTDGSKPTFGELRPYFVPFSDGVVFGESGGLWSTAGSPETTEQILSFEQFSWGGLASSVLPLVAYSDFELHFSDGIPGGKIIDIDLNGALPSYPWDLTPLAPNKILFIAYTEDFGGELWVSDGTPEETQLVRDIRPGPRSYFESAREELSDAGPEPHMLSLGSRAVLTADDGTTGGELWVSDGTFDGTMLLRDIYPGDYPSTPRHLTPFGDRIAFAAEDEAHGLELWVTDGTYDGSTLLKDIAPGAASSIPDDLLVREGVLYFSAWSPNYGREAWKSNGTPSGTVRITDVAPGPLSSSPQRFARAGNRLYFSATDQIHGYELWALFDDSPFPLFLDGFENESTNRWSEVQP